MNEIWKDIKGYERLYQVSNLGRVRSLSRMCVCGKGFSLYKGKMLKLHKDHKGYLRAHLSKNGKSKLYFVHRLVWEAFNGELPKGMLEIQVNHINEDKTDNRLENLNLMTPKENANWGTGRERWLKGVQRKVVQIDKDGNEIFCWFSIKDASQELGINNASITNICKGKSKRKSAGGFKWRYLG